MDAVNIAKDTAKTDFIISQGTGNEYMIWLS
jgi:hypothetical protein